MRSLAGPAGGAPVLRRPRRRDGRACSPGAPSNVHFRPGEYLFHEGEPADRFFVVRRGRVALDVHVPGPGRAWSSTPSTRATSSAGPGWSRRTGGSSTPARCSEVSRGRVRRAPACAASARQDPALGYALMQRVAAGDVPAAAVGAGPAARPLRGRPCPADVAASGSPRGGRRCCRARSASSAPGGTPSDTVTLELEPLDGERPAVRGRASSRCCRRSASARCRSRSAATPAGRAGSMHTIRDVGGVTRALCAAGAGRRARRPRPLRPGLGRVGRPRRRRRRRRRRHRAGAAAPRRPARCSRRGADYGRVRVLYGARTAGRPALRRRAASAGRPTHGIDVAVTVDRAATAWRGRVGLVTELIARGGVRRRPGRWRWSAGPR